MHGVFYAVVYRRNCENIFHKFIVKYVFRMSSACARNVACICIHKCSISRPKDNSRVGYALCMIRLPLWNVRYDNDIDLE